MAAATKKHVHIEADRKRVAELSDKLMPIIGGYTANEIAHAFLMAQFKIGLIIGEATGSPIVVLNNADPIDEIEEALGPKKGKKNGKAYVN
jgi:hypothetical protein